MHRLAHLEHWDISKTRSCSFPISGEPSPAASGFTLIELLLVLSILAIALGLGGPAMEKLQERVRSHAAMQGLASLLSLARQEAILRGRPITVCGVDSAGNCTRNWGSDHIITVFDDSNSDGKPSNNEEVLREMRWALIGAELSWRASLARRYLRFEAHGGTWQNGTLYYCPNSHDARQAKALVMSHSGRSYMPGDSTGDGIREDRTGRNLRC
ncbi:MAG: GspH/FimT family pseudopilin [Pseudomonadota bacterium]